MTMTTMNAEADHRGAEAAPFLFDDWFDPIEAGLASGCAALSRRCWSPSWMRCLPVPAMGGVRSSAMEKSPALPVTGTATGYAG